MNTKIATADDILSDIQKSEWIRDWTVTLVLKGIHDPRAKIEKILEMHKTGKSYEPWSLVFAKHLIILYDTYEDIFKIYGITLLQEFIDQIPLNYQWERHGERRVIKKKNAPRKAVKKRATKKKAH